VSGEAFISVESNTTGSGREFAAASKRFGLRPIILVRSRERYPSGYLDGFAEIIDVDTTDPTAVINACAAIGSPAAVWSSSELAIAMAAEVAAHTNLVGQDPEAVARCRDKALQAEALRAMDIAVPATVALDPGNAGSEEAARSLQGPVVVKPKLGTGSIGVCRFADPERALDYALELHGNDEGSEGVLIQELIVGPEFSAELMNGRVVAIMRKHLGGGRAFVEVGHDFFGDAETPGNREVVAFVSAAVNALGLTAGPAHVELRLGPQGPVIIEVNPRLAGGQIPAVIKQALGVDLVSETLRWLLRGRPRLHPIRRKGASIRFVLAERPGRLVEVAGVEKAKAVAGISEVNVAPAGSQVRMGDFRQRVGYAIAVDGPGAAAAESARAAAALLVPTIAPEQQS
jgi:biotin carboxylase